MPPRRSPVWSRSQDGRSAATSINYGVLKMGFEYSPKSWATRLAVMQAVFPWVNESIRTLAGLSVNDDLSSHESCISLIKQHDEYLLGGRSTRPEVVAIHHRQNAEWKALTGIGPLGSPTDWRAAGHAAGAPADAIQACDVENLARFIVPWAIAKRVAASTGERPAGGPAKPKRTRRRLPKSGDPSLTPKQVEAVFLVGECEGNVTAAAKRAGIDPKSMRDRYKGALAKLGRAGVPKPKTRQMPRDLRGQDSVTKSDDRRG